MKNSTPKFQLHTEDEIFSALCESFYMVTETTGATGECYINSLEILDIDDQQSTQYLKDSIGASWDISNTRQAKNQIAELIGAVEEYAKTTLSEIVTPSKLNDYHQFFSSYQLTLSLTGDEASSAFNLIRASWLTRASFSCGYIDESQARENLSKVSNLIRQQFNSWDELAVSYLVMYLEWNGGLSGTIGHMMKEYAAKERILGTKLLLDSRDSMISSYSFKPDIG